MRIRLEHKTLLNGRYHVITSPDMKGLHVSGPTQEEAERRALSILETLKGTRQRLSAVEFDAA